MLQLIAEMLKSTYTKQSNCFWLLLKWFYSSQWFWILICQGNLKVTCTYSNIIHTSAIVELRTNINSEQNYIWLYKNRFYICRTIAKSVQMDFNIFFIAASDGWHILYYYNNIFSWVVISNFKSLILQLLSPVMTFELEHPPLNIYI